MTISLSAIGRGVESVWKNHFVFVIYRGALVSSHGCTWLVGMGQNKK